MFGFKFGAEAAGSPSVGSGKAGVGISDLLMSMDTDDAGMGMAVGKPQYKPRQDVDDDMTEDEEEEDEDSAPLSGVVNAARRQSQQGSASAPMQVSPMTRQAASPAAAAAGGIDAQIADVKAKITQLEDWKKQRLAQEDYMGAHHVKQMIEEQVEKLQAMEEQHRRSSGAKAPSGVKQKAVAESPAPGSPAEPRKKAPRVSLSIGAMRRGKGAEAAPVAEAMSPKATPRAWSSDPKSHEVAATSPRQPGQLPTLLGGAQVAPGRGRPASEALSAMEAAPAEPEAASAGEEEEEVEGEMLGSQWRASHRDGNETVELVPVETAKEGLFWLQKDIYDRLYPYQRDGVAWMARLYQHHQGGVLADEMGLGKTIQVCALLNGARKTGATHALLILPVSLLDQWAREARKWCPGWPVHIYHGTPSQKAAALRRVMRPEGGILLTTYSLVSTVEGMLHVDVDDAPSPRRKGGAKLLEYGKKRQPAGTAKRKRLDDDEGDNEDSDTAPMEAEMPPNGILPKAGTRQGWDIVVCDEAHKLKSISTLLGKTLRQLKSKCRILMTGTPVQNALQDLWSLMDFAQPGLLGNHATFVKTFSDPIDRGSVRGAKVWAVELKKHLSEQLRNIINPHILRRTKMGTGLVKDEGAEEDEAVDMEATDAENDNQLKQLLPKKETIIWLQPSEEQVSAYQKVLEKSEVIREACAKQKLGIEVFKAIGLLKRLCNHPQLIIPTPKTGAWNEYIAGAITGEVQAGEEAQDTLAGDGAEESLPTGQDDARGGRPVEMMLRKLPRSREALLEQSAKLRCLSKLLPELAKRGHRTLIFCQSLKMLDLIQICVLKPNGLRCLRIDGGTDAQTRAEKVAKFQRELERFQCMLLTTTTGGVGLNLTSADRVILVDPAWNPATDAQAVDRAFRIGQTKEVRVYRLVMSGMIEDKMFRLQVFKMGLTKTALEADKTHNYFTAREIRALFEWVDPQEGETRKMLKDKHGEESEHIVEEASRADGSDQGWLKAGPAVGLSDFGLLYGSVVPEEEEQDDACAAQVTEAKEKLSAADDKLKGAEDAKKAAEAEQVRLQEEFKATLEALQLLQTKKSMADEALREKRAALSQARREETSAAQRLEKANRALLSAGDFLNRNQDGCQNAKDLADAAAASAVEALVGARNTEVALCAALEEVEGQLNIVGAGGKATSGGVVDASAEKARTAKRAFEKIRGTIESVCAKYAELEAAEEELARADQNLADASVVLARFNCNDDADDSAAGSARAQEVIARKGADLTYRNREKERTKAEQAHAKAAQKAETSREAMVSAVSTLTDAGSAFVESFQKASDAEGKIKVDQVKAAQSSAKAALRQFGTASKAVEKSRDAWAKAMQIKRKAAQKASLASVAEVETSIGQQGAEHEKAEAAKEEEARRVDRTQAEADLAAAEAAKSATEAEQAETVRRRDELKASMPAAKEAVRAAKLAEKEAQQAKAALHAKCSKVEKEQLQFEEAKTSAIQTLRSETYDPNQVQAAYNGTKKNGNE